MRIVRDRYRPPLPRLVFELLVVFVGIYSAFALTAWQAGREAAERRQQIEQALIQEIRDITGNTHQASLWAADMVAFYDSAFAAGGRPQLQPLIEPIRVRAHMWEATLESGGLELLDVGRIYELSRFYNELNAGFEQLAQLRALSEGVLIPNLGRDVEEFYEEPGRLRAKYAWYMLGLRNLEGLAERITAMGNSLVLELRNEDVADRVNGL
jgi:hypothetical protein